MWDYHIASQLWTFGKYTCWSIFIDLILKILSPTECTKLMTTAKLISSHILIFWIKLHIHNIAHIIIIFGQSFINIWVFFTQCLIKLNSNLLFYFLLHIAEEIILLHLILAPIIISKNWNYSIFIFYTKKFFCTSN